MVAFLAENYIKHRKEDIDPRFNTTITKEGMFIHPDYQDTASSGGTTANRDVCLLQTNINLINPPHWSAEVRKYCRKKWCTGIACLDGTEGGATEAEAGSACWIAGWGSTDPNDNYRSPTLMQTSLNLLSNKYCHEHALGHVPRFSGKLYDRLHEDEICAGHPAQTGSTRLKPGSNFCNEDSGGPLICSIGIEGGDRRPVLTGVVSWNYNCGTEAGDPGVFARVSFFYDWMAKIVRDNPLNNNNKPTNNPPPTWTEWSSPDCSVSCGGGTKHRRRKCRNGQTESDKCSGRSVDHIPCNTQTCKTTTTTTATTTTTTTTTTPTTTTTTISSHCDSILIFNQWDSNNVPLVYNVGGK